MYDTINEGNMDYSTKEIIEKRRGKCITSFTKINFEFGKDEGEY